MSSTGAARRSHACVIYDAYENGIKRARDAAAHYMAGLLRSFLPRTHTETRSIGKLRRIADARA